MVMTPPEPPVDVAVDHAAHIGTTPAVTTPTAATAAHRWRPLLLRWHFYAGILIGPFLLVAAVTGTLYALIPQVDRAVYSHELTVDHIGSTALPLGEQVAAARAAHPEGTIASVTPAPTAGETTRVVLAVPDVGTDRNRTVFVDPYTGQVRGALTTMGEWLPVRSWFDDLHRNLHLGEIGRNYSEIAASWLWVVALGGLILWIGHRRRTRALARLALPDRSGPRRRRTLSWHGAVGVWIILGLIVLSASGLSWSRFAGENIGDLRTAMSWTTPGVTTGGSAAAEHQHGSSPAVPEITAADVTADDFTAVYATAQRAGLVGPLEITIPAAAGDAWQVSENARGYPSHFDSIAVDPHTFAVTDRVDFAQWPLMAKLTKWAISAHMGLFGVLNQIVLVALGIGLISVIVRGYLMWWRRRSGARALPVAPRRGALGSLLPAEALALIVGVGVLGWFLPWFGIPLALFVIVDAARGMVRGSAQAQTKSGAAR